MIAVWLRGTLVVLALALLAQYRAANPIAAALSVIAIFLALHGAVVGTSFAISRRHASARLERATPLIVLREWLAHVALFAAIQPFERIWLGDDARKPGRAGSVPVLLVHGYMCNRGTWWWMRRGLAARGFAPATVNLEPPSGSIEGLADRLHDRIEALCAETGAARVALVGHSMGGLVARAYLRKRGPARVAQLITLASPHQGTWLACYGIGRNAREMEPDGAWIKRLGAAHPDVPTLTIWTPTDNFIAPADSSRLAGAREEIVPALSHLAMLFSPAVLEILCSELAHQDTPQR